MWRRSRQYTLGLSALVLPQLPWHIQSALVRYGSWFRLRGMKNKRSPGTSILDKLLVPRIEGYGDSNDITDTDAVCEHLKHTYREYRRQKLLVLKQLVERAVDAIARKSGLTKAELRLQVGRLPGRQSISCMLHMPLRCQPPPVASAELCSNFAPTCMFPAGWWSHCRPPSGST